MLRRLSLLKLLLLSLLVSLCLVFYSVSLVAEERTEGLGLFNIILTPPRKLITVQRKEDELNVKKQTISNAVKTTLIQEEDEFKEEIKEVGNITDSSKSTPESGDNKEEEESEENLGDGELGKPVYLDQAALSPEERAEYDLGWKNNQYNLFVSDKISLHRKLKDTRDHECKTTKYRPNSELPNSSVIIIFHNEGWSVLLRTVHSVIDRSPPELLHEVILVDDHSDMDHLQKPLEDYISGLAKVKLVRAARREGLIRARLLGVQAATGEILVFLDSHCEVAPGWLEPMADRIADSWSNVVTPIIVTIHDETFEVNLVSSKFVQVGGFSWSLVFNWHVPPKEDKAIRTSPVAPIRSPTMAGGLFAINRKYFKHIGTYDPGMEIWGGENLELSFRIWMCGGRLETLPCSQVGHIFRKKSPYSKASDGDYVLRNNLRLAEVWMDEYKQFFYMQRKPSEVDFGDVSDRKQLRQRLQCKSFDWYINNVYPTIFNPNDSIAVGDIRTSDGMKCLDANYPNAGGVMLWPCHNQGGNQLWMLSKQGDMLVQGDQCLLARNTDGDKPTIGNCFSTYTWDYTQANQLRSRATMKCLSFASDYKSLLMVECNEKDWRQIWQWRRKKPEENVQKLLNIGAPPTTPNPEYDWNAAI